VIHCTPFWPSVEKLFQPARTCAKVFCKNNLKNIPCYIYRNHDFSNVIVFYPVILNTYDQNRAMSMSTFSMTKKSVVWSIPMPRRKIIYYIVTGYVSFPLTKVLKSSKLIILMGVSMLFLTAPKVPYHGNLEGYLADVFENIFSKEPCQATSAKQRSATVNSTIKHPKWPVPLKAHMLRLNIVANLGFINCNGKI